ncbi:MAG: hypothetical protein V3U98_12455 [Acidobacteriota bacterium]
MNASPRSSHERVSLAGKRLSGAARIACAALFALAAGATAAAAQESPVRITLEAQPQQPTVGDPVVVRLHIRYPDGYEVSALAPGPQWGPFTVFEVTPGEPRRDQEGGWVRTDRLEVAAYEPGPLQATGLSLQFRGPQGEVGEVQVPPLELSIASVLGGEPEPQIADLKGPASLPRPWWPWVLAAVLILAAALGLALLLAWRRRRKLADWAAVRSEPPLPAHEWALRDLERLQGSGLLAKGRWLDYHVILAEVLKEYLTRRFGIQTLELTSSEVLESARAYRLGGGRVADLRTVLEPCDEVKFARHEPRRSEAEAVLARARTFVEATKPAELPAPAAISDT